MDTMGKRIEFYRKKKGLTQRELADLLKLKNQGTISAWEVDTTTPKPAMMLELCKILGITISELFGVDKEETKKYEQNISIESSKDFGIYQNSLNNYDKMNFNELTKEEKEQVNNFIDFLLSKRNK